MFINSTQTQVHPVRKKPRPPLPFRDSSKSGLSWELSSSTIPNADPHLPSCPSTYPPDGLTALSTSVGGHGCLTQTAGEAGHMTLVLDPAPILCTYIRPARNEREAQRNPPRFCIRASAVLPLRPPAARRPDPPLLPTQALFYSGLSELCVHLPVQEGGELFPLVAREPAVPRARARITAATAKSRETGAAVAHVSASRPRQRINGGVECGKRGGRN